jgi:hypothetical protein
MFMPGRLLMRRLRCIVSIALIALTTCQAQQSEQILNSSDSVFNSIQSISGNLESCTQRIERLQQKAAKNLHKQQAKLLKAAARTDSTLAAQMSELSQPLQTINEKADIYLPRLDSLNTMLQFAGGSSQATLAPLLQQSRQLQDMLNQGEYLQRSLREQEQALQQLMARYTQAPAALEKAYGRYLTQAQTYKAQAEAWRQMLNEPDRLEREALRLLNKLPAFQKFMQQNGQLAQLFGPPAANASSGAASLAGLQTRQSVMQQLQQRFGTAAAGALPSANTPAFVQQQLQGGMAQVQQAQSTVQGLVQSITNGAWGNTQLTPQQQEQADLKAKPFGKRLEAGWNLQTTNRLNNYPAVNDMGLSLGYRIAPKAAAGIGVAYKFGLGTWQHIKLTHVGLALRSYFDWRITNPKAKLFANLWVTAGFEMNYWKPIYNLNSLQDLSWQRSGVAGITKRMKVGKKEGKVQVLWDFLQTGAPLGQCILIRYGHSF